MDTISEQYKISAASCIDQVLNPHSTQFNKLECLITTQRIQDLSLIFPSGNIDIYHDFSKDSGCLRHYHMYGGFDAYRATAVWMHAVGPARYMQYVNNAARMVNMMNEVTAEISVSTQRWILRHATNPHGVVHTGYPPSNSVAPGPSVSYNLQRPAVQQPGTQSRVSSAANHQDAVQENAANHKAQVQQYMLQSGNQWRGLIRDYEQYKSYKAAYLRLKDQRSGGPISKIPVNDPQIQARVRGIYEAILDVRDVIDNPRLKPKSGGKKRKTLHGAEDAADEPELVDPVAVSRIKELKSIEIEILSWDIVEHAWNCQQGQFSMPPWNEARVPGKAPKGLKPGIYVSLDARLAKCEEALRHSKNCVKQMLMVDFAKRLAYNPDAEVKRKIDNKEVNGKRDVENKAGKWARAQGLVIVDQDRSIKDANGAEIARAHPFSSRMTGAVGDETPDWVGREQEFSPERYEQYEPYPQAPQDMAATPFAMPDYQAWMVDQSAIGQQQQNVFQHQEDVPETDMGASEFVGAGEQPAQILSMEQFMANAAPPTATQDDQFNTSWPWPA